MLLIVFLAVETVNENLFLNTHDIKTYLKKCIMNEGRWVEMTKKVKVERPSRVQYQIYLNEKPRRIQIEVELNGATTATDKSWKNLM